MKTINLNKPTHKVKKAVLITASDSVVIQGKEQFIIKHTSGTLTTCNLETLNALVNELQADVKIIANLYHDQHAEMFAPVLVRWY